MMIQLTFETAGGARGGSPAGRVAGLRFPGAALRFAPDGSALARVPEAAVDGVPGTGDRGAHADWRHAGRMTRRVENAFVVVTLALLLALGAATMGYALDPAPVAPPARVA